jgi:hypothetical protein
VSERDLQRLLDLWEKTLGTGWLDVADWLRSLPQNSVEAIEQRLLQGDIAGLIQETESAALRFAADTHSAYTAAGKAGAEWLDGEIKDKLIRYDASGSRVIEVARRNQLELVHGFQEEQNQITRQIVRDAMINGTANNPRVVAQQFRDAIGLAPNQEQWVRNYRRALEQQDWSKALGYELSSGHADRTVRVLQRDGGALSSEQIDSMVERYRQNAITSRAENIARTEASKNVHQGIREAMQQAVDRGDIEPDQLVREWIPGPNTKDARHEHRATSLLEQRPRFDQPYRMPDGSRMMHPGDPAGGARNTASCQCTEATTLT